MNVDDFFAKGGPLDRAFPAYKPRPGQLKLAQAVEETIVMGGGETRSLDEAMDGDEKDPAILVSEAPVGVGKTAGYLAPALLSGKRTIVATATLALQDQIAGKDLPTFEKALGPFKWQVLKGMNNYLCQLGHSRTVRDPPFDELGQLPVVSRWAMKTLTGDLGELDFDLSAPLRRALTVSSEECVGTKCPKAHTCHVLVARARARDARVVVVNYHLLYADLAVRAATDGHVKILPDADVLVLDEAHRAAEIARDCSGFRVTLHMVTWIARHLSGGRRGGGIHPQLGRDLEDEAERFFGRIESQIPRTGILETVRDPGSADLCRLLRDASHTLQNAPGDAEQEEQRASAGRRAGELAGQIEGFFARALGEWAYWVEKGGRRAELRASPLDVSGTMRELFGRFESVVLTSATLRDGKGFELVERECGIASNEGARVVVDSPFDFSRSTLVCPEDMPEANAPAYKPAVARLLERVVKLSGGKTLALFTSYAALEVAHEQLLRARLPFKVLRQGDMPRQELLKQFASDVSSVLLGTDSFWEGVDVPGAALSVVFIDKLPFPRPDDPVVSRLIKLDKRRGYSTHAIGRAVRRTRQGIGRLVRREGDFGVVVVADGRLFEANYSERFLRGLPGGMGLTRSVDDVDWAEIREV